MCQLEIGPSHLLKQITFVIENLSNKICSCSCGFTYPCSQSILDSNDFVHNQPENDFYIVLPQRHNELYQANNDLWHKFGFWMSSNKSLDNYSSNNSTVLEEQL